MIPPSRCSRCGSPPSWSAPCELAPTVRADPRARWCGSSSSKASRNAERSRTQRACAREGPELARDAVLAALEAHAAASTSGLVDLVVLVRALEARGFQRDEVHAELVALSRAGGWELRPESAVGAALEDAALCPRIQDGPPLAWARART